MKKAFKIIFKEISTILTLLAIPTFALILGLSGKDGVQLLNKFEPEHYKGYMFVAIFGYILAIVLTIDSWYHDYYLPYKKSKEQQPTPKESQEETVPPNKEETISSTIEPTKDEEKALTYWEKVVSPCKNIMTIVIVLMFIRFTIPQESWFLNIVFLGFLGYMIWCMNKANKKP
ncbi:hypothetical protein [Arcobacter sp. FWKO B]|uniref:hypothetical protein n=1 Tax=Arcobacter sp. FWKO B TaxID=2593672 RepID=UPI0018A456B5|nr:hypothetical protein [Arcobacter sp. FWKO B]QOG11544.1 hypothetical protein FWKOB_02015 [Arcobacter sp. FWKO B]